MARNIHGVRFITGQYRVTFDGTMTKDQARAECVRLNSRPKPAREPEEQAGDFDRGFGIGGLARHGEPISCPEQTGRRCHNCGQYASQGAMFTTDPTRRRCDDCF